MGPLSSLSGRQGALQGCVPAFGRSDSCHKASVDPGKRGKCENYSNVEYENYMKIFFCRNEQSACFTQGYSFTVGKHWRQGKSIEERRPPSICERQHCWETTENPRIPGMVVFKYCYINGYSCLASVLYSCVFYMRKGQEWPENSESLLETDYCFLRFLKIIPPPPQFTHTTKIHWRPLCGLWGC